MKRIALLLIALAIGGCGYTTGSLLPSHLKTIYVSPFRNKIELTGEISSEEYRFRSYRARLETDLTKEVMDRFINDGNLKLSKEEDADLIMTGEVVDYLRQPVRYDESDSESVEEYRFSIVCSVTVKDVEKDIILWQESRIIGDSTYDVSGSATESSEIANAVSDIARRIVNRTIEGW
jgi:hypothetical protein